MTFARIIADSYSNPSHPNCRSELSPAGFAILAAIREFNKGENIRINNYIIMPDHIHYIVEILKELKSQLGNEIARFKSLCSKAFRQAIGNSAQMANEFSLFDKGFNDRIIRNNVHLRRCILYIEDNPRRYIMRRDNPNLFYRRHLLCLPPEIIPELTKNLQLAGYTLNSDITPTLQRLGILQADNSIHFHLIGNIFLLERPSRVALRESRKFSDEERLQRQQLWADAARAGDPIISPFLSDAEKQLRDIYSSQGATIIHLLTNGLAPREYPQGINFNKASCGQLLQIAPPNHLNQKEESKLSRSLSLFLNAIAYYLATHTVAHLIRPLS